MYGKFGSYVVNSRLSQGHQMLERHSTMMTVKLQKLCMTLDVGLTLNLTLLAPLTTQLQSALQLILRFVSLTFNNLELYQVHRGLDGRYYCLDFSRLFPPEAPLVPTHRERGAFLYKLLRPEFVMSYPKPLCSDA